jgi:hypothetical protein
VADFPLDFPDGLSEPLLRVLDTDEKIPRALEALGPIADRDVLVIGGGEWRAAQLERHGARVTIAPPSGEGPLAPAGQTYDAAVSFWSAFHGPVPEEVDAARRILQPGGRLLVIHDYGRDDVSTLRGDRPEYGSWGRRDGPFLTTGFRIRVLHTYWTFESLDEAAALLGQLFGDPGRELAATLRRPRLTYKVAVYHRGFDGEDSPA